MEADLLGGFHGCCVKEHLVRFSVAYLVFATGIKKY